MNNNNVRMLAVNGEDLMELLAALSAGKLDNTCDECQPAHHEPEDDDKVEAEYGSDYIEPGEPDYVKSAHIVSLVEDVTINTLSAPGTISLESAQTLHTLASLREEYR